MSARNDFIQRAVEIDQLSDLHSRLELEDAKNGSALQKFNIPYHNSAPLLQLKNGPFLKTKSKIKAGNRPLLVGTKVSRKSIPWAPLTELLFAFGKVTNAFAGFPEDGEAIITHWLQTPQSTPVGMSPANRRQWLNFIAELLRTKRSKLHHFAGFSDVPFPPPSRPSFRFVDIFAGIGGFRLGLQNLGWLMCVFLRYGCNRQKLLIAKTLEKSHLVIFEDLPVT